MSNQAVIYIKQLIQKAGSELHLTLPETIHLEHPANTSHGDYASNIALTLSKHPDTQPEYKNPRALAEKIVAVIQTGDLDRGLITAVSVAGPGFINFELSEAFLVTEMGAILKKQATGQLSATEPKTAIVEYSSPNIAKPFTIGHLRSTIIGDALANILEFNGWRVLRDNHLGDWGTQFGKQIYALKHLGEGSLEKNVAKIEASEQPVKELVKLYVEFHEKAETQPELEEQGREWFKKLEQGDSEARELWQKCIDWSWQEFKAIYDKLGVSFSQDFNAGRGLGESFFEDKMNIVIDELKTKGLLQESQGAQVVFFPDDKYPPLMIIKKDGATLYATRDLATDYYRFRTYGQDVTIINEVGAEQSLYFRQLFETEKLLGWIQDGQRVHVGHGLYRFADKKMSTRKGNVIWLADVLQEAFERVKNRSKKDLSDETMWQIAVGALKWHDLKKDVLKDVVFDYDEMLSLQGNSGPYIQYTVVRCQSILEKAGNSTSTEYIDALLDRFIQSKTTGNLPSNAGEKGSQQSPVWQLMKAEIDILRNLYTYKEVVEKAGSEYAPHHVCTYLFELAQQFNSYYANHRINDEGLEPENRQLRVALTAAVAEVLTSGLGLLGIQVVDEM